MNQSTLFALALSINFAFAGDGIVSMECKPLNPAVTIDGIQSVRIVIDDHIQEYAHVETEDTQGTITEQGIFDPRRDSYQSIEVSRDESESPMVDVIRLERAGGVERLVKTRTAHGRGITIDSVPVSCAHY